MNYFNGLWDDFISLLFPRICYGCGNHLIKNEKLICTECYVVIPRTNFHLKSDNPVARLFWGRCLVEKAAAFSYYSKDSRIRRLIHRLKYSGIGAIGTELGRIYALSMKGSEFLEGVDLLIPVPLHFSKRRKRGFNQSELITYGMSEITGLPVDTSSLIRRTRTRTQTRKSRYDRWTNVEDIFKVTDPEKLKDKHILLVDDVITTGSTIEACVNELLKTGNVRVSVVALAFAS